MDPNIESIILGVIANGLTTLISYLGSKGWDRVDGNELMQEIEQKKISLGPILQDATTTVSEELDWDNPNVHFFLASPDVEALVRQVFAAKLAEESEEQNLTLIRQEFTKLLALHVGLAETRVINSAKVLYEALIYGCEQALNIAIDRGILSAHEAKSAYRYHIILNELAAIQKNLDFLVSPQKPHLSEILEYEKDYRQQVGNRHRYITPPDFDKHRRQPINRLYVDPDFIIISKTPEDKRGTVSIARLRNTINRTVLLGDPGSGKSTFAFKLCHDLATRYKERLLAGRQVTPVYVTLRDYGAAKKERACSILLYIEEEAVSVHQLQTPPPGTFEYMLLNGRAVVIFDGLDELLDTSYRQGIRADIESFSSLYPSVPVLVTSRKVGYEQAPLDRDQFDEVHLAPFNKQKAESYVRKWFRLDANLTASQQAQKTSSFMVESRVVPDLRANPLLLALMCNIYRGEGYIPRNRPDVYEKCATMLFERWDKGRGIDYLLPFEAHIKPVMMYLAYWIYSDEKRESGVTEKQLIEPASDYLHERRFENRDEAEYAARTFVEFSRGRAWVFTDTGTTKGGEELYQFTHRTFLEYFTAAYLVRKHPTPDKLIDILLPRIVENEWDVVAQLAFQLQNKNIEEAGDKLLSSLLQYSWSNHDDFGWNALSFAVRSLEFIVPSPQIRENITEACVNRAIKWESVQSTPRTRTYILKATRVRELLSGLCHVATENLNTVSNTLEKKLAALIKNTDEVETYLALEITLALNFLSDPMFVHPRQWAQAGVREHWKALSDRWCKEHLELLSSLYCKHLPLWHLNKFYGRTSVQELIEKCGIESIFLPSSSFALASRFSPPAETIVREAKRVLFPEQHSRKQKEQERSRFVTESGLAKIGEMLIISVPPWTMPKEEERFLGGQLYRKIKVENKVKEPIGLEPVVLFGLLGLQMIVLEKVEKRREYSDNSMFAYARDRFEPYFGFWTATYSARYASVDEEAVQRELDRCNFSSEQQAFVLRWVNREIDLVEIEE